MTDEDRINLIRRGNELFNKGDFKNALKIFLATNYRDGIVRVADHLYYDENKQVAAIKLYKKAGYTKRIEEFAEKAALTIRMLLDSDKLGLPEEVTVSESEIVKYDRYQQKNIQEWQPRQLTKEEIVKHKMKENKNETKSYEE